MYFIGSILCNSSYTANLELVELLKCKKESKRSNHLIFFLTTRNKSVSTGIAIPGHSLYQGEYGSDLNILLFIKRYETIKQSLYVSFVKEGCFKLPGWLFLMGFSCGHCPGQKAGGRPVAGWALSEGQGTEQRAAGHWELIASTFGRIIEITFPFSCVLPCSYLQL